MTQSDAWYLAQAETLRAKLTEVGRQRYGRLAAAAGVDPDKLTPNAQLMLVWLAGWDEDTVAGAVEILGTGRAAAALATMAELSRQAELVFHDGHPSLDDQAAERAQLTLVRSEAESIARGLVAVDDVLTARRDARR